MLKINDYLTPAEREQVLSRSDLWAWWLVLSTWTLTLGLLWLAAAFPHPATILLAWALLRDANWVCRCSCMRRVITPCSPAAC